MGKHAYLLLVFSLLCLPVLAYSSDVLVWQGQYYTEDTFNTGTYTFNFTVYDALTGGNACYSNETNLTTGNWGQWKTEQVGVSSACNNASKDYFLNININGLDQPPRRRVTIFNYIRKDTNENTIGNMTVGNKIALALGAIIQNIYFGWLNINTNVNLGSNNLTTTGYGQFSWVDKIERVEPPTPPADTLRFFAWDFKGFSAYKYIDDTGMVRQLARDNVFVVKNDFGSQIDKAIPVYDCGSSGNVNLICPADASNISKMPAIGITIEDIADGDFGRVMMVGILEDINTNAYADGSTLYVACGGGLTDVPPITPNLTQEMGTTTVQGIGNGAIQIISRALTGDEFGTINNFTVQGNLKVQGCIQYNCSQPTGCVTLGTCV